jgi:formate hydrogenlyase subunit 3/multisubunit Na+/H+ antiporter MnhD subunit
MITLFVFYIHVVAAVAIFTKRWQEANWKEGLLSVGFLILIFSVGWSITTFIMKLFVDPKGFGIWLDRDAMSLLLLMLLESLFFTFQIKRKQSQLRV